jgi:septal ring factor EnvC (AmiA/AmiB activator)
MQVAILFLALAASQAAEVQVVSETTVVANPVRKVVNLLKGMQKKVTEEGEKGKELYEKFMCYCKNAGGDLKASMSAADTKIPAVGASIKEAEAQLTQAKADLKEAQADRSEAKAAMASATALREKTAKTYAEEKSMYDTNIAAIAKATASLEKGMSGAFLQTASAQSLRKLALDRQDMLDSDRQMLLAFLSNGENAAYVPSSGEVTGILKQMGDTMKAELADATSTESGSIKTYGELMSAKTTEVNALTSTIEAKTVQVGELGVSIIQMKNDLSETEAGLLADQQFLADMEKSCSTKSEEWNEAVKLRAEELAALAETIKVLNDDDALELFKKTLPSAASSFMQVKVNRKALRARALRALDKFSGSGSPQLDLIMVALKGKGAGFEKVIGLIDEMVKTLKKEQLDDDHKKEYCAMQFDVSDDKKKALEREISDGEAFMATTTESIATLGDEIAALEAGVKALDKEVASATEQRKEEDKEYTELMASDSAAKELLLFAKNRLAKFYNPKLYKAPPKRDLSAEDSIVVSMGGTLAPTAPPGGIAGTGIALLAQVSAHVQKKRGADPPPPPPEAFEAYAKKGEEATGVVTMMDMLIKDLDEEMTEAKTAEEEAQREYETMMKDSAMKRVQDLKTFAEKTSTKADLESDVEAAKETKLANTKQLMATLEYIQSLHAECDWLLQYFDVRKSARAGEVDALKDAKAVLSGADYSLLQREASPARAAFLARK